MLLIEKSKHIASINKAITEMIEARKVANRITDLEDKAFAYCNAVKPLMLFVIIATN